jgi:hypothetical protein
MIRAFICPIGSEFSSHAFGLDFLRNFKRIACSDRKRDAPIPRFSPWTYPSSLLVNLVGAVLMNFPDKGRFTGSFA